MTSWEWWCDFLNVPLSLIWKQNGWCQNVFKTVFVFIEYILNTYFMYLCIWVQRQVMFLGFQPAGRKISSRPARWRLKDSHFFGVSLCPIKTKWLLYWCSHRSATCFDQLWPFSSSDQSTNTKTQEDNETLHYAAIHRIRYIQSF